MHRSVALAAGVVLAVLVVCGPATAGVDGAAVATPVGDPGPDPVANATAGPPGPPRFESVYPNPLADGDVGESVLVRFPEPTNVTGWTLVDDAGHVAGLPDETLDGRVRLSPDPGALAGGSNATVRELDGRLRLANGGDVLALRRPDDTVVDEISYDRAPEAERYHRTDEGTWRWRPLGATSLEPVETVPASATTFVLPDAPEVVESELRDAERRILLAGYTLSSERVADALVDAHERGVEVRVLLEGAPVGGVSSRQADALDRLVAAGIQVAVLAGERDPFRYHHAKYAVVDDRAIVLSENWKPSGTGGHSNRGWGVVLRDQGMATGLASLFEADRTGPGTESWTAYRDAVDPVDYGAATDVYPRHFPPEAVPVERARLLVAPDNARRELAALVRSANESVAVHQVGIDGTDDSLLRAAIDAARNGTEVEILLSSADYAASENRALASEVDAIAAREDLPITADLANPRGRFDSTHVKGVIVDERHVVVGSLNWNPTAYGENREVVVALTGEEVAGYYAEVFRADARERTRWRVPIGVVATILVAWLGLGALGWRRISWGREPVRGRP